MTAGDLYARLRECLEELPEDAPVSVSLGRGKSRTGLRAVTWTGRRLLLEPEEELVRPIGAGEPGGMRKRRMPETGQVYRACGACGMPVNRVDRYCRECGQRLR